MRESSQGQFKVHPSFEAERKKIKGRRKEKADKFQPKPSKHFLGKTFFSFFFSPTALNMSLTEDYIYLATTELVNGDKSFGLAAQEQTVREVQKNDLKSPCNGPIPCYFMTRQIFFCSFCPFSKVLDSTVVDERIF